MAGEAKEKNMNLVKVQAWFFPLMILLIGLSNLIVIFIGGQQYMDGIIEIGVLAEFIIYINISGLKVIPSSQMAYEAVSYTHLTLPTKRIV